MSDKFKFIYQLILSQDEFRSSEDVNNWVLNPYPVSGIDDKTRRRAIDRLKSRLPEEVFVIRGNEISFSGNTKKCAEDYGDQLINHAIDIRTSGFGKTKLDTWPVTSTLYGINDYFIVGRDRTNPVPFVLLLSFLEDMKFGPTTFRFGSVSIINDDYGLD